MEKKLITAGLLLAGMVLSGFWVSRSGKPINTVILTVHKLISLGTFVFLVVTVIQIHRASPLTPLEMSVSILTGLLFLVLIATGGLLSAGKSLPALVTQTHHLLPYFLALSSVVNLYLVLV